MGDLNICNFLQFFEYLISDFSTFRTDYFHELETTDDSNRIVDEILRHAFLELKDDSVELADQELDLGHLLTDGKGKLARGRLTGVREVLRKGNSKFYKMGDDITVKATLVFPELQVEYADASIESQEMSAEGSLRGNYRQLRVNMEVSHHETEHTNKVDVFEVKGYRESVFRYRKTAEGRSGREQVSFTTNDVMEEIRVPLLKAVEQALRKTAEDHILAWR